MYVGCHSGPMYVHMYSTYVLYTTWGNNHTSPWTTVAWQIGIRPEHDGTTAHLVLQYSTVADESSVRTKQGDHVKNVVQLHNAICDVLRTHMGSEDRVITPEMDQAETRVLNLLIGLVDLAQDEKRIE